MTRNKIHVSIDGQNFFWIVTEIGRIISKNPTKEELSKSKAKHYNKTNICPRCIEDNNITDKSILYPGNVRHEKDKDGKVSGKWICKQHYDRYDQRYNPISQNNIRKLLSDSRTGNLDQNSSSAKGRMFEELTCKWRGIKSLNIENDNLNSPIDHSRDHELGIIQTQGRVCNLYKDSYVWTFAGLERDYYKQFDFMIFYCTDEDMICIERIYIFPKSEIIKRKSISIYKNPSKGVQWYEEYRVKDENVLELVNNIWNEIMTKRNNKGVGNG